MSFPTRQFIVDERGEKAAAILPIEEYEQYLDILQDLDDLKLIEEVRGEDTIALEALEEGLRNDGLLARPDDAQR